MLKNEWFEVDKEGLAKILERRGKSFVVFEIFQNAWDQNITRAIGSLEMVPGRPLAKLTVADDDPNGFADLSHAFTLFAESGKKGDPTKRGRFNLGEKLVLACCEEAEIITTTGGVRFLSDGSRQSIRKTTERGSIFSAMVRMTREEFEQVCGDVKELIPPDNIYSEFNGKRMDIPTPLRTVVDLLPTEISDDNGMLKRTIRKTQIHIHQVSNGKPGFIYEMGIPVVETGDTFNVNIMQKVPLNMDRDNVTAGFLKQLRTIVLNATYDLMDEKMVQETWIKEALSDKDCSPEAVSKSLDIRYGTKRVAFDPSDQEANKRAMDQGYSVVHGRSLTPNEWTKAKGSGAIKAAGQIFPTGIETSFDGKEAIKWEKLTNSQKLMVLFTKRIATALMGFDVDVKVFNLNNKAAAFYGGRRMAYNIRRLGKAWFTDFPENIERVLDLIIHELAHENAHDHFSEAYYRETTRLGAKMTIMALRLPHLFDTTTIDITSEEMSYEFVH